MLFKVAQALGGDVFDLLEPQTPYTLETLRARQGLLQADVVTRGGLGVGRAFYSRVERGQAALGEEDTRKLAVVLQVEPDDVDTAIAGGKTVGSVTRA
jgi:transcriptional regulator with XRE-family HTH domain